MSFLKAIPVACAYFSLTVNKYSLNLNYFGFSLEK